MKNKATSTVKIQQIISSLGLSDVGIYSSDAPFLNDIGIVNLHPSTGTHLVVYINEKYFVSYGCVPPQKLSIFNINRNSRCFYSEYKIQGLVNKRGPYCASYCLYIIYVTKVIDIELKSAVFNLYYQRIS